jgi:hypothetical protein
VGRSMAGLFLLLSASIPAASAQGGPDPMAVDAFWPVYEALLADRSPADDAWDALFAAPAWRVLGSFRAGQARGRYELAFRPSRGGELAAALARDDYEATVLRHLRTIVGREPELRAFRDALEAGEAAFDLGDAIRRAADYLPAGAADGSPVAVGLAFFEPDGYADGMVVADLLYLLSLGPAATGFLAHELHHVYQARHIAPFARPAGGTADQVLLETVFQLQREGVANLVANGALSDPERADWFSREVARSPDVLALLDERLRDPAAADSATALRLAREIRWRVVPGSGHPTGYHMARTILEASGRDALIATLANPFDFVRAYNQVAGAAGGRPLGPEAMAVLEAVERRTFGAG